MVTLDSVLQAAHTLEGLVHSTPVLRCHQLDAMCPGTRQLYFKCELFQKTGSFKARGASNAVANLPDGVHDVVTHSSGNHAQALAWAAKQRGITAHIVMPRNAPAVKVAAVKGYGANVYLCEPTLQSREETAAEIVKQTGGAFVHPSNDPVVISGQGTVGLELLEQVEGLDAVIVPVGGGGLIAGIATAIKGLRPEVIVIGAEPANADDAFRSKESGVLCTNSAPVQTMADGLMTVLGSHTFPVVMTSVDKIVTVSEEEIARAVKLVYERMKLAIEPSAGVGVAVALGEGLRDQGPEVKKVGIVLCGGNVDLGRLPAIFELASDQA